MPFSVARFPPLIWLSWLHAAQPRVTMGRSPTRGTGGGPCSMDREGYRTYSVFGQTVVVLHRSPLW